MKFKALKVRIYPNVQQTTLLNKTFGCSRFIYNTMLSERKEVYSKLKDKENVFLIDKSGEMHENY